MLCMAAISGIVSGPLAYASTSMEGVLGLHGWQYLFILEGAPTVVLALFGFYLIFDNVDDVQWLTAEQKAVQRARMQEVMEENSKDPITWKTIRTVLLDYKTWLFSTVFMLTSINLTSLNVFGPVLIDGMKTSYAYIYLYEKRSLIVNVNCRIWFLSITSAIAHHTPLCRCCCGCPHLWTCRRPAKKPTHSSCILGIKCCSHWIFNAPATTRSMV